MFDFSFIVDFFYELVIKFSMLLLGFVEKLLILIFDIAGISFFSDSTIGEFTTRVYIILGVLMLFKITISCIQYLINPDKAEDKESGFGGILKRTLISVILLALVPSIFTFAKEAQGAISEALPKIILGRENGVDTRSIAGDIAYTTALGFFNYKEESCNNGSIGGLANASNPSFSSIQDISQNADIIATEQCNGQNRYNFNWFFCIVTGVFLNFIVISMVIDVGIRTIKFGFLELIAPIPIASYIDPKSSKKSFDSWVHNTVTVYVDLFVRLGVIYFILYLFEVFFGSFNLAYEIPNEGNIGVARSMLVNVAIIIALFMFAKNAPKFICDILGIKMDGDGSIAGMFKRAAGFAATPLAAMAAGAGSYRSKRQWGAGRTSSLGGGLRAAMAASARGLYSSSKGGKITDVFKNSRNKARAAADKRYEFKARAGNTFAERFNTKVREGWDTFTGVTTGAEQVKRDRGFYEAMLTLKSNEKKNALAKVNSLNGFVDASKTISGNAQIVLKNGNSYNSYVDFLNELNGLQQIPFDQRTSAQTTRLNQLSTDKDLVEKFMIRNQTHIALTNPNLDEGNYSAIAQDVIKIVRSGSKDEVDKFLTSIGGGNKVEGQNILDALTKHKALTAAQAISLNDYIAGALESDAQKGISEATARERTIPKS